MTGMFDTVDRRLSGGEDADRAREIWKIMDEAFDKGGEARGPRISGRATTRGLARIGRARGLVVLDHE